MVEINTSNPTVLLLENDRAIAKALQQWDKDIKFYIKFENMPPFFEVHFAYPNRPTATVCTVQTVDGMAEVQIPNECLQQNKTVYAWVYIINEYGCRTTKTIEFPIKTRTKPDDYVSNPDPTQKDLVQQLIEKANTVIEKSADKADKSYVDEVFEKYDNDILAILGGNEDV